MRILRAAIGAGVRRVVMTRAATVATPPLQSPDSLSDETVWFDHNLGHAHRHSAEKSRLLLSWQARPAEDPLIDCATSLIDHKAP